MAAKSTSHFLRLLLLHHQRRRPFSSRPLLASETSSAGGGEGGGSPGEASATTTNVLLIHGLLGSGRNWRSAARALAAGAAARAAEVLSASSSSSSASASSASIVRPPRVSVTAIDLRCHGGSNSAALSPFFAPPHGISEAAADVIEFASAAFGGWEGNSSSPSPASLSALSPSSPSSPQCSSSPPPAAPDVLIGHSLGGKVALEAARQSLVAAAPLPRQLWVVDSPLSARRHEEAGPASRRATRKPPRAAGATAGVLAVMRSVPASALGSRREAEKWLVENNEGMAPAVAAWLCSQLVPSSGGVGGGGGPAGAGTGREPAGSGSLVWQFDPAGAAALFESYQTLDAWPLLRCPPAGLDLHVVVGGKSDRWSSAERRRLEEAEKSSAASAAPVSGREEGGGDGGEKEGGARRGSLKVHLLPKAGHWVHVDDQDGLLRLLVPAVAEVAVAKALKAAAAATS